MPIDTPMFKNVLSSWASGVTIVTSRDGETRHGMTVSAFCAVSAEPPQVLICTNRQSSTHGLIARSRCFTVNVLSDGQEALANLFADKAREDTRFAELTCTEGATGCPRIPGAHAYLDCQVVQAIHSGTHMIYIGLIEAAAVHDTAPMLFYRGRFSRLG